jgi:hypothetical protein
MVIVKSESVFKFFPAPLVNIPEALKMVSLSGSRKRPQEILRSKRGFFDFESSFQNKTVFEIFLSHLVCLNSVK